MIEKIGSLKRLTTQEPPAQAHVIEFVFQRCGLCDLVSELGQGLRSREKRRIQVPEHLDLELLPNHLLDGRSHQTSIAKHVNTLAKRIIIE